MKKFANGEYVRLAQHFLRPKSCRRREILQVNLVHIRQTGDGLPRTLQIQIFKIVFKIDNFKKCLKKFVLIFMICAYKLVMVYF